MAGELGARYEQLPTVVLGGHAGGNGLGLGVLAGRGMAAWMGVWRSHPPPASSVPAAAAVQAPSHSAVLAAGGSDRELVHILAAMALAHV